MSSRYVLGIDTSNYKTSVAIVDEMDNIICDLRTFLKVKEGEKGLRQSYALFQHIENLPEMIRQAMATVDPADIAAVAFSSKPRPQEGSYMPVFKPGETIAIAVAAALQIPVYGFSHQEGHLKAIKAYSELKDANEYLAYHLSGGTCELLKVSDGKIEIIGGSKDISFGQLIDRAGVALGMSFPAGEEMDNIASQPGGMPGVLNQIKLSGLEFNLSGIETQMLRSLGQVEAEEDINGLVRELFYMIGDCMCRLTEAAIQETGIHSVIFAGGVSQSRCLTGMINEYFKSDAKAAITFGRQSLSQDNAVGTALLGGDCIWH